MSTDQQYHSKIVTSNQPGIHKDLDALVQKHIRCQYLKPYQQHNLAAFEQLQQWLGEQSSKPLILDSCCGTAMSSRILAQNNPHALVVGIDQSYVRLNKSDAEQSAPENLLLLRANCEDLWRLCVDAGIRFHRHYILYPNPWPKAPQVKRRWHGHPVFPWLKDLADYTELRSNWEIYLQEFNRAWELLTADAGKVEAFVFDQPMTLFEIKYAESGQTLYRLKLTSAAPPRANPLCAE